MELRRLLYRTYNPERKKWVTLRIFYLHFNTRHASNVITFQLPVPDYEKVWSLIPTITYRHDPQIVPGPSFTMVFKWLKWHLLTVKWQRSFREQEEEETAEPMSFQG